MDRDKMSNLYKGPSIDASGVFKGTNMFLYNKMTILIGLLFYILFSSDPNDITEILLKVKNKPLEFPQKI
jgi:hypothetical protein